VNVVAGRSGGDLFFFFTLVTGRRRNFSLKLSDGPQIRARLGTTAHFCEVAKPQALNPIADYRAWVERGRGTVRRRERESSL